MRIFTTFAAILLILAIGAQGAAAAVVSDGCIAFQAGEQNYIGVGLVAPNSNPPLAVQVEELSKSGESRTFNIKLAPTEKPTIFSGHSVFANRNRTGFIYRITNIALTKGVEDGKLLARGSATFNGETAVCSLVPALAEVTNIPVSNFGTPSESSQRTGLTSEVQRVQEQQHEIPLLWLIVLEVFVVAAILIIIVRPTRH